MKATTFSEKHPAEILVLSFDFTNDLLTGETITGASRTVETTFGTDAAPSSIFSGVTTFTGGKLALQGVQAGLAYRDYLITMMVTTSSGRTLVLQGILPVRRADV